MKKLLFLLPLTLLVFVSCSSFPANESGNDSMILFPIVFDKSIPGEVFGSLQLTISDGDGNFITTKKLSANVDYTYVKLQPGQYKISKQVFLFDSNKKYGETEMDVPFEVMPGAITVFNYYLLYNFYSKSSVANTNYMHYEFKELTQDVKDNLIAELEQEEAYSSWTIDFQ